MKYLVPDYYPDFACIKGACRHSCCTGWEIDIDEASLEYFRSLPGSIGDRLRENIDESAEGASFRLSSDERCPFLNAEGLCDLILELGEGCLCDICADHPRFRSFFSDREETGLGMCCEEAARIILTHTEPTTLITIADDENDEVLTEDEEIVLNVRSQCIATVQKRFLPMEKRIDVLLQLTGLHINAFDASDWVPFLLGLERLDEAWTHELNKLSSLAPAPVLAAPEAFEAPFEQLMVYLLQRHLSGAVEDGDLSGRIAFCLLVWWLIKTMLACQAEPTMEKLIELCRMYSSEIEYSDENIDAVLSELHKRNPSL